VGKPLQAWCCEKGEAQGQVVCKDCAETSAAYQAELGRAPIPLWLVLYQSSVTNHFHVYNLGQHNLLLQLKKEAGIDGAVTEANYDDLLFAAGKHGIGIQVNQRS